MAGLLYFVPGLNGPDLARLASIGLDPIVGRRAPSCRQTTEGPDGTAGVVLVAHAEADGAVEPRCGYFPAEQTWARAVAGGYWIGYQTDAPPRPVDLQRKTIVVGHAVRLEDDHDWIVPLARVFPQGSALPRRLILGPDGTVVEQPLERFAALSARASRVWDGWRKTLDEMAIASGGQGGLVAEGETLDPLTALDEAYALAADALALNYRIGVEELNVLGLVTSENLTNLDGTGLLDALVDLPTIMQLSQTLSKKNEAAPIPDGSSSGDGAPAC